MSFGLASPGFMEAYVSENVLESGHLKRRSVVTERLSKVVKKLSLALLKRAHEDVHTLNENT